MINTVEECAWGRKTGIIKKRILKADIERGVKFLSERAYSNSAGITKSSALFFLEVAKHIDVKKVNKVTLENSSRHWYTVNLHTKDGYVIQLKGLSFGYLGEGSRGTIAILKACGFTNRAIGKILTFPATDTKHVMYRKVVS
jgi:hypothetical protein